VFVNTNASIISLLFWILVCCGVRLHFQVLGKLVRLPEILNFEESLATLKFKLRRV
jgi:hypothetical protein